MATLPGLPALHVNPPAPPLDPLAEMGKVASLRNLGQQSQENQLAIQEKQMQLQDQQAMTSAMHEWDGKDLSQLPGLVLKHGGSAQAVFGLKQKTLEQQKTYSDIAHTDAETGGNQLKNLQTKNDLLLGSLKAATDGPDETLGQRLQTAAQGAVQQGILDPQHAQVIQQLSQAPPDVLKKQLTIFEKSLMGNDAQLKQASDEAGLAEKAAQLPGQQAESVIKQREATVGSPQFQEARYRFVLQQLAAKKPVADEDMAAAVAYEASQRKTTSTADSLGITSTNTSKPGGLAALRGAQGGAAQGAMGGPSKQQSTEDSIVDLAGQYKLNPQLLSRMLIKHPEVLAGIQQKYPDFDQTTYNAKNKAMIGYTSGTQSKEINAINTAMGHMRVLDDAVQALNNGDVTMLNKIGNQIGINLTGQTAAAAYKTILHRVGPEITAAYIPGAGGEGERIANAQDFSENLPPQTLHNNIGTSVTLLRSKINSLENQYKNTVGRDDFQQRFITPEAQASFQKFAGQGGGGGGSTSGKSVSLAAAKQLPINKGKSDDDIRKDIEAHGHSVAP